MDFQMEFTTERYNTVKDSLEGFKKEISSMSARNEQLSNLCAKHEETVCTLRNVIFYNIIFIFLLSIYFSVILFSKLCIRN